MRGPKIVHSEQYHTCGTGGSGSHISSGRRQADTRRKLSTVDPRHLADLADSSSSVLLGPSPVTPIRASKRMSNPPRSSRLPPSVIRLPARNAFDVNQHQNTATRPSSMLGIKSPDGTRHVSLAHGSDSNGKAEPVKKPASPKLYHIHGLSDSENFPFAHKHAIALRAGLTSPLTYRSSSPKRSPCMHGPPDYPNMVYYGGKKSPSPVVQATAPKPQFTTVVVREVQANDRAAIDLQASSLHTALAGNEVHRKDSPQRNSPAKSSQVLVDVTNDNNTFDGQDIRSTKLGGMRFELKGGSSSIDVSPRLRSGTECEEPSTNTFRFKLKEWLLTCHGPCPDCFDTRSDADLPPPRIVSPETVAKTRQKMNGTVPLPVHLSKRSKPVFPLRNERPGTQGLLSATAFTTTISDPGKGSMSLRLTTLSLPAVFHRQLESLANQLTPLAQSEVPAPPFPHLRGGAEPSERILPTLFWLAGGTGKKRVSFKDWKRCRSKQRMGGLFGMAVFGDKYGQGYKVETSAVVDAEVERSAGVRITVDDTVSATEAEDDADASSSSSNSNLGASPAAGPIKEITAGLENVAPTEENGLMQRALTPPPAEPVDDVPLCSGALPVDPIVNPPGDSANLFPPVGISNKDADVVSRKPKEGSAQRHW